MPAQSAERSSRATLWLSGAGGVLGVLGLAGHVLGLELLTRFVPGRPPMQPTTAILLAVAAAGIALRHDHVAHRARRAGSMLLGGLTLLVASLVLAEYLLGIEMPPGAVGTPRRLPSPFTAGALGALGGALLVFDVERPRVSAPREWLCLTAVFLAFVGLVGHAFGAGALYQFGETRVIGLALPTGLALTALGVAALLARPQVGLMRLVTAPGPGGVLLRRLGLIAMVFGPLLGAGVLVLVRAMGLSDLALVLALGSVAAVFFALLLLVATATPIERLHEAAEAGRARVRDLLDQAPEGIFVADLDGRYTEVNDAGCRLLGYRCEEILGKTIVDLIPQEDVARLWASREQMLEGAVHVDEWRLRRKDGTLAPVEVTAKILPDGRWQGFVHDISARLELERKLVDSRDFLQKVLESSTEYGIVAENLERRVVLWNEGARLAYGYALDEIEGTPSDRLVAPDDLAAWRALHARALERGKAEGTITARRKDGSSFTAKVVCTRRLGGDQRAEGVLVVSRDLTAEQRHAAEQEFLSRVGVELASCLEYRATVSRVVQLVTGFLGDIASIDVVAGGDVRRAHVAHSTPGEAQLAGSIQHLGSAAGPGHPLATVLSSWRPVLLAHITSEDRRAFATSPEHARVLEEVCATSAMLVPLIARGQLLAVLSIAACKGSRTYGPDDVRLAEQLAHRAALALDNVQLLEQSRLQAALAANLAEGVALVRTADSVILYVNPRLEAMFGYEAGELPGMPVRVLQGGRKGALGAEARRARLVEQLELTGTWHGEIESTRKDGSAFWCAASISTYDHEQHGKVWISLYSDITERKLLEQKNAQALRDKEVLLREIHHRVKNNLQVISSLFSLQRERTHSAELKSLLDESQGRLQSIALVHEQLYSSADLATIDFDQYLGVLIGALRSSYGANRVSIETSAKDVLLDVEQAVPCALLTCELVSNSIKHAFGDGPGTIRVHARRDEPGYCVLEVADDGRGMPADFDWRNAHSLGLRLVRALAHQLRGTVELDRARGTRFCVRFPLSRARAHAAA